MSKAKSAIIVTPTSRIKQYFRNIPLTYSNVGKVDLAGGLY